MPFRTLPTLLTAFGLATATMTTPLLAQSAAPQAAPSQATPQASDVSEGEIQSFARAVIAVERLKAQHRPDLEAAADPDRKDAIRTQAMTQMVQAVKAEGLSVERYNGIYTAQRADPELAQRVEEQIAAQQ